MNNSKIYLALELFSSLSVNSPSLNLFSLSDKIIVNMCVWQQYDNRLSQPNGHSFIHLWKLIEENLIKMESIGQKVILLCRYLSTSTQIPKETVFLTGFPLYYRQQKQKTFSSCPSKAQPAGGKIIFSLALNSSALRDCITLPMESCSRIWLFLWVPKDYSLPVSSVHGIIQARTLEWLGISSFREFSWPRDLTRVS